LLGRAICCAALCRATCRAARLAPAAHSLCAGFLTSLLRRTPRSLSRRRALFAALRSLVHIAHQLLNPLRLGLRRFTFALWYGPLRLLRLEARTLRLGHRHLILRELKLVQVTAADLVVWLIPRWVFWHASLPSLVFDRSLDNAPARFVSLLASNICHLSSVGRATVS